VRPSGVGQSALLLLDAIEVLAREKIDYAVIGAMAASIHGVVRASLDADVVLSLGSRKRSDLEREFKSVGFQTELQIGGVDDPIPAVLKLMDSFKNKVDLLVGLRGLEPEAFSRAIEVKLQGASIRIISLEDFIAMKVFAAGPQDMADARNAIRAGRDSLDLALVRRLAMRYGRDASLGLEELLRGRACDLILRRGRGG
jgi:predicted nucleotidyltransferase